MRNCQRPLTRTIAASVGGLHSLGSGQSGEGDGVMGRRTCVCSCGAQSCKTVCGELSGRRDEREV
eukprot:27753-Eustigmatos_ZCMA.PRE.1